MAQQYTRRVSIINTPVPVDCYPMKNTGDGAGGVTLGWIGSRATVNYLELLRDVLTALTRRFPFVKIKVVSDDFPKLEGDEHPEKTMEIGRRTFRSSLF